MKKIVVLLALLFVTSAFAQNPVYTKSSGSVSWTISVDTSQQMYGCTGYHNGPPCNWYYHTGDVAVSMTNMRTGKTASGQQTVVGGLAVATAILDAQPGDVISYSETNRVYCPAAGVWYGFLQLLGHFEIAQTRFKVVLTPTPHGNGTTTYPLSFYCSGNGVNKPDYITGSIDWTSDPNTKAFDLSALCWSQSGRQPWSCINISVDEVWDFDPGAAPWCTINQ